jgi:hypothetical protein
MRESSGEMRGLCLSHVMVHNFTLTRARGLDRVSKTSDLVSCGVLVINLAKGALLQTIADIP